MSNTVLWKTELDLTSNLNLANMGRHRSGSYDRDRDSYKNPSNAERERVRDHPKDDKRFSRKVTPDEYRKRRRSRSGDRDRDDRPRRRRERSGSRDRDEERKDKKCVSLFHSRRCSLTLEQTQARQI